MHKPMIILATGEETIRRHVQRLLCHQGWAVNTTADITALPQTVRHTPPDLLIIGLGQNNAWHGVQVARDIRRWDRTLPVILLTLHSSEELVIAALRDGVCDYFTWPLTSDALVAGVLRCLANALVLAPQPTPARATVDPSTPLMIGNSPPIQQIKAYIRKMANIDCNVLITGETGTGKEVVATLIHQYSKRQQQPLVTINCAAIPESLLESELFGYERGAFTGAHTASPGALQQAQGGTVFLDEIGDMSPYAQAKVLRAIESKEIRRLGGKRTIPLNIRIIAATNQDLERLVADGSFRKDLYFRLNVACIHLPPLRDRKEDIPLLLTHYIQDANRRFGRAVENFTVEAIACLLCYEWPGNVRELKNVVETTFFNLSTGHTAFVDLPELLRQRVSTAGGLALEERDRLLCALYATKWNKSKAAQKLHWSRMTLYRKMTKYHIIESIEKTDAVPLSRESPF